MTPAEITTAIAEGRAMLVPVEPTEDMAYAGARHLIDGPAGESYADEAMRVYRAMLSASPIDSKAYAAHVAEMEADARRWRQCVRGFIFPEYDCHNGDWYMSPYNGGEDFDGQPNRSYKTAAEAMEARYTAIANHGAAIAAKGGQDER